jgi:type IV secretion system protein VirB6
MTFFQQTFNGDYSILMWIANVLPVTMVILAFVVNMLFIPQITQAIFGGSAGATASAQNLATSVALRYAGRRSNASPRK